MYKFKFVKLETDLVIDSSYQVLKNDIEIGIVTTRYHDGKKTWFAQKGEKRQETNSRKKAVLVLETL